MPNSQVSHTSKFLKQILRRKITRLTWKKKYRNKLKLWKEKKYIFFKTSYNSLKIYQ